MNIVLGGMVAFSLVVAAVFPDLGLNLFAEAVGVAVTIGILDALLKRRDRQRLRPVIKAMAEDAGMLSSRVKSLALHALETTAGVGDIPAIEAAAKLSEDSLKPILERLAPSSTANVAQIKHNILPLSYWQWDRFMVNEVGQLKSDIHRFIERYVSVGTPDVVAAVHALEKDLRALEVTASLGLALRHFGPSLSTVVRAGDSLRPHINAAKLECGEELWPLDDREALRGLVQHLQQHPQNDGVSPWRSPPAA